MDAKVRVVATQQKQDGTHSKFGLDIDIYNTTYKQQNAWKFYYSYN